MTPDQVVASEQVVASDQEKTTERTFSCSEA